MQEKRKHKRYKKAFDVKYSCAKGPLIIEQATKSKDISEKGIRLPLDENLKVSDRVRLAITLPWRHRHIDAIAKIVWASPRPITSASTIERDCGLEFTWASAPNLEELLQA